MPVDFALLGFGRHQTLDTVQDQMRKAKSAIESLRGMTKWQKAPKLTAMLGDIKPNIYQNNPKAQNGDLAKLPNEIQHMIWSHLTEQPDRLMLALTCKWHATVYEDLKTISHHSQQKKVLPKKRPSTIAAPNKVVKKPRAAPITKLHRLAVLHRLAQTIKDERPFIPKSLQLCYTCVRFIPKDYTAAPRTKSRTSGFNWGGKTVHLNFSKMKQRDLQSQAVLGHRCPDCVARAAFENVSLTKEYKEWKKAINQNLKI